MNDLAKRAVACKGWRWLKGSESLTGFVVLDVADDGTPSAWAYLDGEHFPKHFTAYGSPGWAYSVWENELPDLRVPATLGCLVALVRGAWDDQGLRAEGTYACGEWRWRVHGGKHHGSRFAETVVAPDYASEAESLVAALEAGHECPPHRRLAAG